MSFKGGWTSVVSYMDWDGSAWFCGRNSVGVDGLSVANIESSFKSTFESGCSFSNTGDLPN